MEAHNYSKGGWGRTPHYVAVLWVQRSRVAVFPQCYTSSPGTFLRLHDTIALAIMDSSHVLPLRIQQRSNSQNSSSHLSILNREPFTLPSPPFTLHLQNRLLLPGPSGLVSTTRNLTSTVNTSHIVASLTLHASSTPSDITPLPGLKVDSRHPEISISEPVHLSCECRCILQQSNPQSLESINVVESSNSRILGQMRSDARTNTPTSART